MTLQGTVAARPATEALQRAQAGKSYWTRVRERLLGDAIQVHVAGTTRSAASPGGSSPASGFRAPTHRAHR